MWSLVSALQQAHTPWGKVIEGEGKHYAQEQAKSHAERDVTRGLRGSGQTCRGA